MQEGETLMEGMRYEFIGKPYLYSSSDDVGGWTIVPLPEALSKEIRDNFKLLEEGWGRMRITAKIGNSEWQTSIWFDTKQGTYFLPLKAGIRKKEKIICGQEINIVILI